MLKELNICILSIFLCTLCFGIIGCNQQHPIPVQLTSTDVKLTPYFTPTMSQTPTVSLDKPSNTPSPTIIPSPTPTPFTYKIVEGDTLTSIAYRHGTTTGELIAANPDIDPNFLTIGITITIPISQTKRVLDPTPIPLRITPPDCYRNSINDLWCMVLVENNQPVDVENVVLEIIITTISGDIIDSEVVFSPLLVIPSSVSYPFLAHFTSQLPVDFQTQARIMSVLPKSSDISRYLTPEIEKQHVETNSSRRRVDVSGEISVVEEQDARQIWILGIAYSKEGIPIGVRKWESKIPLKSGNKIDFNFTIYSLGPPIFDVDLFAEAQP